ncbi:hypothetical protein TH53_02070 [Pedobacter lusitanus]|uniref:Uncharacterized protein n=1 Tax=Pedobacter lusitanus TaxID=1503925 RepID=A0A0D0FA79_9SPHI|nr:carboxypeptidase-like regulatory domain-containing protein [Pedobacter lusitanus]KIO78698.1 hypothetical protein TH53_02070 [Pedobacter lusitanus]
MNKLILLISFLSLSAILIFSRTPESPPVKPVYYSVPDQGCTIHVAVVDEQDIAFPGATIKSTGKDQGILTNPDGQAEIKITEQSWPIVISFIGYQHQEINVACGQTKPYLVQLYPDSSGNFRHCTSC